MITGAEGEVMSARKESIVFSPAKIGGLELKNRLVRSATYENAATLHGEVTDTLVGIYRDLAQGGVGLIITGITTVMAEAHYPHRVMFINDDRYIAGQKRIADAVHSLNNGCKVMMQLHHPGRQVISPEDRLKTAPYLSPARIAALQRAPQAPEPETDPTPEPVAPSAVPDALFGRTPRALSIAEIEEIIAAFAEGIRRAEAAGFDGVQLHAAHGWLLSSFLSPHTNKREDRYGGSIENRTRIVREIYEQGRKKVAQDFPILIKMNTTDFFADGTSLEDAVQVTQMLADTGFCAFEPSGGMWETVTRGTEALGWPAYMLPESRTNISNEKQEAYFLSGAQAVKEGVGLPVMLVGGMKSFHRMEEILAAGKVDFISMSRPLIRQPDLPNLFLSGQTDKADCTSCNGCLGSHPLHCVLLKNQLK
jgi:2,4-dienoyl-CoA reductase-like NADH-dependent reductase (Old Yellow Enzyme family)